MRTVFSYIVQNRFSQVNEDVATEALAYLLESSDAARRGMMKLLRGIVPGLPPLRFKVQQAEGAIRPDMRGFDETEPRVFVENKFWAGLTDNQPATYLKQLEPLSQPTILLAIGPAERQQTLWRELTGRLRAANIALSERATTPGVTFSVGTQLGPILALTSWTSVLSVLEHEAVDDPSARGDLIQLGALCEAADIEAFAPFSSEELSDQRTPAFVLQLGSIVMEVVHEAVAKGVLSLTSDPVQKSKLKRQAAWERIGHYVRLANEQGAGAWLGIHFDLWKAHGTTPLWLLFSAGDFGRGTEVCRLLKPWVEKNKVLTGTYNSDFAIALGIPVGEEKAGVVRGLLDQLKSIARELEALPPKPVATPEQEGGDEVPQ